MLALIDGDIVAYRVGWTTNDETLDIARYRVDEMMHGIFSGTRCDSFKTFLSDSAGNFRLRIFPEYKANRKKEKPRWLADLKLYLLNEYKAILTVGEEADDAMGIYQDKADDPEVCHTIICTIDKDLNQIAGHHFNFVTKEGRFVTKQEGVKMFYHQLLMGDFIDNIKGVPGIGKAKAKKILMDKESEEDLFQAVRDVYIESKEGLDKMLLWGQLLKIRTQRDELWTFPKQQEKLKQLPGPEH